MSIERVRRFSLLYALLCAACTPPAEVAVCAAGPGDEPVSGEATLTLPTGRTARIDAEIGEHTAAATVGP